MSIKIELKNFEIFASIKLCCQIPLVHCDWDCCDPRNESNTSALPNKMIPTTERDMVFSTNNRFKSIKTTYLEEITVYESKLKTESKSQIVFFLIIFVLILILSAIYSLIQKFHSTFEFMKFEPLKHFVDSSNLNFEHHKKLYTKRFTKPKIQI